MLWRQRIMTGSICYQLGVPESLRVEAAQLYDEAFGRKFSVAIGNTKKRRDILAESFLLEYAVAAISKERLVGLAGFHTQRGALTSGMSGELLLECLGTLGGLWAALIFSIYARRPQASELLMDGIAVRRDMRGKGVGTHLLNDLKQYARDNGFRTIRLDVIDTNPAARRLYKRQGFVPTRTERFGYLRWLLGFGASTTMIFNVEGGA
jgi:GNAT superfamily N-acetyltransferase